MKMTCRDLAEFLGEYVDGALPADVVESFESHLTRCPSCREYLAQYTGTIEAGRRACSEDDRAALPAMPEELVRAILEACKRSGA